MENTLRSDTRREVRRGDGTLLLHDEEEYNGSFTAIPIWENVKESDIMTPRDVYDSIIQEGYRVSSMLKLLIFRRYFSFLGIGEL